MSEKFRDVPVEEDTVVLFESEAALGDYDVLYQKWAWDGIVAESAIFREDDIADLDDKQLESLVRESPIVHDDSQITIKRNQLGFAFVNFNFDLLD